MKFVGITGKKGGIGKTTLAHCLAYGSVWANNPGYLLHTDDRRVIEHDDRPYFIGDCRTDESLAKHMKAFDGNKGITVIDGGGNRSRFDLWLANYVDLLIIPVTANEESVELANDFMKTLLSKDFDNARFLINKYPTNAKRREVCEREYFQHLDQSLVLGRLKNCEAVDRMTRGDTDGPFTTPATNVNNTCRTLYRTVQDFLTTQEENEAAAAVKKDFEITQPMVQVLDEELEVA